MASQTEEGHLATLFPAQHHRLKLMSMHVWVHFPPLPESEDVSCCTFPLTDDVAGWPP